MGRMGSSLEEVWNIGGHPLIAELTPQGPADVAHSQHDRLRCPRLQCPG